MYDDKACRMGVRLLAVSEAVIYLHLFVRCLFCQAFECLPSWHRIQLCQRQCTTSTRGAEGSRGSGRQKVGGLVGGVMRAKSRVSDAQPLHVLRHHPPSTTLVITHFVRHQLRQWQWHSDLHELALMPVQKLPPPHQGLPASPSQSGAA